MNSQILIDLKTTIIAVKNSIWARNKFRYSHFKFVSLLNTLKRAFFSDRFYKMQTAPELLPETYSSRK
jgi:hypothetical protein